MAKEASQTTGNRCYLFISQGKFYETPRVKFENTEAAENSGFVLHKYTFAGEEQTTFRKYYDNVSGRLVQLGLFKDRFNQKSWNLVLVVEDDIEINQISIPWKTSKGSINLYARNIISKLDNLEFDSNEITLAPFEFKSTEDDGSEKLRIGVTIVDSTGEKVKGAFYEDIPKFTVTKNDVGEDVKDYTEQNKYYFAKLTEIVERFKSFNQKPASRPKSNTDTSVDSKPQDPSDPISPTSKTPTPVNSQPQEDVKSKPFVVDEFDDDLPF